MKLEIGEILSNPGNYRIPDRRTFYMLHGSGAKHCTTPYGIPIFPNLRWRILLSVSSWLSAKSYSYLIPRLPQGSILVAVPVDPPRWRRLSHTVDGAKAGDLSPLHASHAMMVTSLPCTDNVMHRQFGGKYDRHICWTSSLIENR